MFDAEFGRDLIAHQSAQDISAAILRAANQDAQTPTQSIGEAVDRIETAIRRDEQIGSALVSYQGY